MLIRIRSLLFTGIFVSGLTVLHAEEKPEPAAIQAVTGELAGSVLHAQTEAPIPVARIQIESVSSPGDAKLIPVNPSEATFSVSLIPGDYKLRISADGFVTALYSVTVKERRRARLTLRLSPLTPATVKSVGEETGSVVPVANGTDRELNPEVSPNATAASVEPVPATPPMAPSAGISYETMAAEAGYNSSQLKIQPLRERVDFGDGQTALSPSAMVMLDKLVSLVNRRPRILKIVLRAGSDEKDPELRKRNAGRRAVSVKNHLVSKGIDTAKINIVDSDMLEERIVTLELVFVP